MGKGKKITDYLIGSVEESTHWQTFRINGEMTPALMKKLCVDTLNAKKYIYGYEKSKKGVLHSHVVVCLPELWTNHKMNKAIKSIFDVEKTEFSKSKVRTSVYRAIQYCVKDGEYYSYKFDESWLKNVAKQATKKFDREEFKEKMFKNEQEYYQDEVDFHQFMRKFGKIRDEFGQKPMYNSAKTYGSLHLFHKDDDSRDAYYDNISNDILQSCIDYSTNQFR